MEVCGEVPDVSFHQVNTLFYPARLRSVLDIYEFVVLNSCSRASEYEPSERCVTEREGGICDLYI